MDADKEKIVQERRRERPSPGIQEHTSEEERKREIAMGRKFKDEGREGRRTISVGCR